MVLIPAHFARFRKITVGSAIDIEPVRLVRTKRRRYRLSELMFGYKRRHRHGEWKLGGRVEKEVW